ncbi:MAG TPA: hypothetical protein VF045_08795 [Acidimicrobiales bacterium]
MRGPAGIALKGVALLASILLAALALHVGGGWGLVIFEGTAALLVSAAFLARTNSGGDDEVG